MFAALRAWMTEVGAILRDTRDIIDERVCDGVVPSWAQRRGWTEFLESTSSLDVRVAETQGWASCIETRSDAPDDLVDLIRRVSSVARAIPQWSGSEAALRMVRGSPRKAVQTARLLAAAEPLFRKARRVVDVGSGRGGVSLAVASTFDMPVIGVEIVGERVCGAQRIGEQRGLRFVQRDGVSNGIGLMAGDLALGLHACGQLGDTLITEAIAVQAGVALVTCCVQKLRAEKRDPISEEGKRLGFTFQRGVLGLANLTARERGVEAFTADTMQARWARCALRMALRSRGKMMGVGEEMRGINRRKAMGEPRALVEAGLRMHGELPLGDSEWHELETSSHQVFEQVRRLTLPRNMLGPILELAIVLDRARALEEKGYEVELMRLFPHEASPRNLLVLAWPSDPAIVR